MTKRRTAIDYAIWATLALTIALLAYLGYAVYAQRAYEEATSPVARAIHNLEAIVRKQPSAAGGRLKLASAYASAGRLDDAVAQYEEVLKLDKENPSALVGLGEIAMKREEWTKSEGYWTRVIAKLRTSEFSTKDDRLEAAYYYLGCALIKERRFEDAVGYLKAAARIRADASDTYYALSVAYREMGSPTKSIEQLRIALQFDPQMPEANYDFGEVLLQKGDVAGAAERFRLSADKAPDIDKPRVALNKLGPVEDRIRKAQELVAAGKVASATVEARVAVAVDPKDVDALRLLGKLYEQQNRKPQALTVYRKIRQLVPEDADAAAAEARLVAATAKKTKNGGK